MLKTFINFDWSANGIAFKIIILLGVLIFFATLAKLVNYFDGIRHEKKKRKRKSEIFRKKYNKIPVF
jgi:hypothetical protein